jgi:hypothetical protein
MLAADTIKSDKKSEIKYEFSEIDFRDAILKAADAGKFNIIIPSGIEGNIAVNIVKIDAEKALKLFATVAGSKIIEENSFKIIVKKDMLPLPAPTPVPVVDDTKYKVGSIRKAQIRPLLKTLFSQAKTDVILGQSIKGTCLIRAEELPISQLVAGLMKANKLTSTTVDGIPFIGTKTDIELLKQVSQ